MIHLLQLNLDYKMKNFEKELENLAMYIQAYEDTSLNDGEALN